MGEAIRVVVAAAVEALVGRAAHARARDLHVQGRGARLSGAQGGLAVVDDLRIGEADDDVEAARSELLEVARLVGLDERLVRLGAVQRVGLQPLLTARDAIGRGRGDDFVQARVEVRDHGLAGQGRLGHAVRLEVRTGRDHPHDGAVPVLGDRASIQPGEGVDHARQGVGYGHVELVVGELPGGVTKPARLVEHLDLEAAQSGLVGRDDVDATAGVFLPVERVVVLEHEHRDLGCGQRCLLQEDVDRRTRARAGRHPDLRAAHGVAADRSRPAGLPGARGGECVRAAGRRNVERPTVVVRATGAADDRIDAVARQDRDEVALGRVEIDLAGVQCSLLRARPALTVADVAYRGLGEERLAGFARDRSQAARRHHRHRGRVEVVAEAFHRQRRAGAPVRIEPRPGGVDLALGIDEDGAVFLDDPAVVRDLKPVLRIPHGDDQVRGRHEDDGRGGGAAQAGRGCRRIGELHTARKGWCWRGECRARAAGAGRDERPIRVHRHPTTAAGRGQRMSAWIRDVAAEHARRGR